MGSGEFLHLLCEVHTVILDGLGSYIPSRPEHIPVLLNLFQLGRLAESRFVFILARALVSAPCVIGERSQETRFCLCSLLIQHNRAVLSSRIRIDPDFQIKTFPFFLKMH